MDVPHANTQLSTRMSSKSKVKSQPVAVVEEVVEDVEEAVEPAEEPKLAAEEAVDGDEVVDVAADAALDEAVEGDGEAVEGDGEAIEGEEAVEAVEETTPEVAEAVEAFDEAVAAETEDVDEAEQVDEPEVVAPPPQPVRKAVVHPVVPNAVLKPVPMPDPALTKPKTAAKPAPPLPPATVAAKPVAVAPPLLQSQTPAAVPKPPQQLQIPPKTLETMEATAAYVNELIKHFRGIGWELRHDGIYPPTPIVIKQSGVHATLAIDGAYLYLNVGQNRTQNALIKTLGGAWSSSNSSWKIPSEYLEHVRGSFVIEAEVNSGKPIPPPGTAPPPRAFAPSAAMPYSKPAAARPKHVNVSVIGTFITITGETWNIKEDLKTVVPGLRWDGDNKSWTGDKRYQSQLDAKLQELVDDKRLESYEYVDPE